MRVYSRIAAVRSYGLLTKDNINPTFVGAIKFFIRKPLTLAYRRINLEQADQARESRPKLLLSPICFYHFQVVKIFCTFIDII